MSREIASPLGRAVPRIEYRKLEAGALPDDVLFAVDFGLDDTPRAPRRARVRLEPLSGAGLSEVWVAHGPVTTGFAGEIRYAADDHFLAGAIELDEARHGGLAGAAEYAYRSLSEFQARSPFAHVLRIWNYLDAINDGEGDAERYRIFCSGRSAGQTPVGTQRYPAATAIGKRDGRRVLQVYWLASRTPGLPLENPRQMSAYNYPREYGPTAPTFSRAMLVTPGLLMISGTASIVGHASQHEGDTHQQLSEIFTNLESLFARAHAHDPTLPQRFSRGTLIKAYLRHRADLPIVERELREKLPGSPFLILLGDVCRGNLLIELDCLHGK